MTAVAGAPTCSEAGSVRMDQQSLALKRRVTVLIVARSGEGRSASRRGNGLQCCARRMRMTKAVLISTYELGHQPFGLASPAAWLRARGAEVTCFDLSREAFREAPVREADAIAFYVPMHTATRLATQLVERVRTINPRARLCFYGLYAPVNEAYLRGLGVEK